MATAYSITEAFGFEKGLSNSFREAPIFLGVFTFLVALGALIAMMPGLPIISVLLLTQVINGVLLPVILFAILRLVNDRELMGSHVNGPLVQCRRLGHRSDRFRFVVTSDWHHNLPLVEPHNIRNKGHILSPTH